MRNNKIERVGKILLYIFSISSIITILWEMVWKGLLLSYTWIFLPWLYKSEAYTAIVGYNYKISWIFELIKIILILSGLGVACICAWKILTCREDEDKNL